MVVSNEMNDVNETTLFLCRQKLYMRIDLVKYCNKYVYNQSQYT